MLTLIFLMSENSEKQGWSPEAKAYRAYLKTGRETNTLDKKDKQKFKEAVKTQRTERLEKERGPFEMALIEMLQQEKREGLLNDTVIQRALVRAGVADLGALAQKYQETFQTIPAMQEHLQTQFHLYEKQRKNRLLAITAYSQKDLSSDDRIALQTVLQVMFETDLSRMLALEFLTIPSETRNHFPYERSKLSPPVYPLTDENIVDSFNKLNWHAGSENLRNESTFLRPDVLTTMRRFGQHKRVQNLHHPFFRMSQETVEAFVENIPSLKPDLQTTYILRGEQYVPKGSSPEFIRAEKRTLEIVDEALEQIKELERQWAQERLNYEASNEKMLQQNEQRRQKELLRFMYRLYEITNTLERSKPPFWKRLINAHTREMWSALHKEQDELFKEIFHAQRFMEKLGILDLKQDTPENRKKLLSRVEDLVLSDILTSSPSPKELTPPSTRPSRRSVRLS